MDATMDARIPVCVFAKPSRPGVSKTRLAPRVGAEGAARLAQAFLEDTWTALAAVPWARPVLATTGIGTVDPPARAEVWRQGVGDLGARLSRILRRALLESEAAIAIGSDTPGLPPSLLGRARDALQGAGSDAVLGPCEDGGFYLIGLRRLPQSLLAGLPWSSEDTFTRTLERLRARGLATEVLPPWFDVDRPEDLDRLCEMLARGEIAAPATRRALGF
jgi:hypothetical protein